MVSKPLRGDRRDAWRASCQVLSQVLKDKARSWKMLGVPFWKCWGKKGLQWWLDHDKLTSGWFFFSGVWDIFHQEHVVVCSWSNDQSTKVNIYSTSCVIPTKGKYPPLFVDHFAKGKMFSTSFGLFHWIDWFRGKIKSESPSFTGKINGFRLRFSQQNQSMDYFSP